MTALVRGTLTPRAPFVLLPSTAGAGPLVVLGESSHRLRSAEASCLLGGIAGCVEGRRFRSLHEANLCSVGREMQALSGTAGSVAEHDVQLDGHQEDNEAVLTGPQQSWSIHHATCGWLC